MPKAWRRGVATAAAGPPSWLRSDEADDGSICRPSGVARRSMPRRCATASPNFAAQIRALGPVNEEAAIGVRGEPRAVRLPVGPAQRPEAGRGPASARQSRELESVIRDRFRTTFKQVNAEFERYFNAFFRGGTARLELGESGDDGLPGIEIVAQPPGKKLGSLTCSPAASARSRPSRCCSHCFRRTRRRSACWMRWTPRSMRRTSAASSRSCARCRSGRSSSSSRTTAAPSRHADTIYGVSMGADSVSRVLSLRLADIEDDLD